MASYQSGSSVYDSKFYAYNRELAVESAEVVIPVVLELLPGISSVVDFGCAQGIWLRCWMDNEVKDLLGIDGNYVDRSRLAIPSIFFQAHDLNDSIDLKRRFELACSLEVAEHLRPEQSECFVESLTRHAGMVLFSAAPPGQGGESHINERSPESWRAMFRARGYKPYDCVRPMIQHHENVAYWYRYNIMLYVREDIENSLSIAVRSCKIEDGVPLTDVAPPLFRLRKLVIRSLPDQLQNILARAKATVFGWRR
jgi:hypothetical protein